MQMVGGQVMGGLTYAAAGSVASLSVPAGQTLVAALVIMEATFSGSLGAKEAYIDEVYLVRIQVEVWRLCFSCFQWHAC